MTDQPTVTLQDLANCVQVIDVATARGAIRGEELSGIGQLRDKLVAFLQASQPAEDAAEVTPENPQA